MKPPKETIERARANGSINRASLLLSAAYLLNTEASNIVEAGDILKQNGMFLGEIKQLHNAFTRSADKYFTCFADMIRESGQGDAYFSDLEEFDRFFRKWTKLDEGGKGNAMKEERYTLPPNIRRSIQNKSRADRQFFDHLIIEVWCQCKRGAEHVKAKSWEEWADIELPCYSSGQNAIVDEELGMCFNTARNKLSRRELEAVQRFIDTHTFEDITDAKRQLTEDFTDSCMATALNIVEEKFYPKNSKNDGKG